MHENKKVPLDRLSTHCVVPKLTHFLLNESIYQFSDARPWNSVKSDMTKSLYISPEISQLFIAMDKIYICASMYCVHCCDFKKKKFLHKYISFAFFYQSKLNWLTPLPMNELLLCPLGRFRATNKTGQLPQKMTV